MTTRRNDHLDDAIDRVAARLTQVSDDPAMAARIVDALPERGWGWMPIARLATAVVAIAVAGVAVQQRFFDRAQDGIAPASPRAAAPVARDSAPPLVGANLSSPVGSPVVGANARSPISMPRDLFVDAMDNRVTDHEFGLTALPLAALSLEALEAPDALPQPSALELPALTIDALPAPSDTSQKEQE